MTGRADGSYQEEKLIYAVKTLDNYDWRIVGVSHIDELVTAKETRVWWDLCSLSCFVFSVSL